MSYRNSSLRIEQRVADLLSKMTLEERCAQLQSQIIVREKDGPRRPEVGHVRNPGHFAHRPDHIRSPAEVAEIIDANQQLAVEGSRLGIPVLQNGEALHQCAWGPATCFPQSIALAATWDVALMARVAATIARELRAVGVRQVFAPVINIARNSRWGRAQESYGEDPFLSARMGVAFVKALEAANVVATPKHFVANYGDGGRDSNAVHFTERYLREVDLVPFEAAVREGKARGIMPAYNSIDGVPCSTNHWLLTALLRDEWGFDGIVVSDYGALNGVTRAHKTAADYDDATCQAFRAGMDVDLPNGGNGIAALVQRGLLDEATVNRAVARVLKLKFQLGLFEEPYVDPGKANALVRTPADQALALEAARRSMTLLKNERNTLPLSKNLHTIGVFGPAANIASLGDYTGAFGVPQTVPAVTPLEGIRKVAGQRAQVRLHEPGQDAGKLAQQCDVAIVFTAIEEAEASDRSNLGLSPGERASASSLAHAIVVDANESKKFGDQSRLISEVAATGVPTVVVLLNGSALTMSEWIEQVPAILEAWYPGEQGGTAIAEALFGDVNPGGRLPITFPKSVGQVPIYYNFKPSGRGYAYNDNDGKPLFPFGFGLSYTTFEYSNLRVTGEEICFEVKNTGVRPGDEVAQLYIHDVLASVTRPVKELRGFTRLHLEPGQTRTVTMRLGPEHLSMWNAEMKRVVEPGAFEIMVGASSEDIRLRTVLTIEGE